MRTSIRTRLVASLLAVALVFAVGLSAYFLTEIEAYGLRKLEERLYTTAGAAAALMTPAHTGAAGAGKVPLHDYQRPLTDFGRRALTRLRVVDEHGVVVLDSAGRDSVGSDYSKRTEIRTALAGRYGAATRKIEQGRVALYVATPILARGKVVGAVYASSTTFSVLTLITDYRRQLVVLVVGYVLVALVVALLLSRWLARPLRKLAEAAGRLAGDHAVRVEPEGPREVAEVADALNALAHDIQTSTEELHTEEKRKSRFVSDVSHELRTPLTAIRGAAETLAAGDVPPEDAQRFLNTIVNESDRLARLASDLLTLQRIEGATGELPLRRTDLREVAELAVLGLEPVSAERGVGVSVDGEAPTVLGDRDRLQQVVANLVDNATRMTPAGGTVRVRLTDADGWAELEVRDQGPGIAPGDIEGIFGRFYRSEPSRDRTSGGAGLGLAIVRAIVEAHAGTIDAANMPTGGAVFTVRLPAAGG